MHPVDMDKIATWPTEVTAFLTAQSKELRRARGGPQIHALAEHLPRHDDAPPMPRWDEAKALIETVMGDRELVAFHATKLIDFGHDTRLIAAWQIGLFVAKLCP